MRILVWRWALDFVSSHPFGGGFWAYLVDRIEIPGVDGGPPSVQYARAWHNIFVAVLAQNGFVGITLYVSMIVLTLSGLQRVQRLTRRIPEHLWCADFAQALQVCLITLFAAGNFVEFGWQPVIWYLFSMAVALREYVRRAVELPDVVGRAVASAADTEPRGVPALSRTAMRKVLVLPESPRTRH